MMIMPQLKIIDNNEGVVYNRRTLVICSSPLVKIDAPAAGLALKFVRLKQ